MNLYIKKVRFCAVFLSALILLTSCAKHFEEVPYSEEAQSLKTMLQEDIKSDDTYYSKLQLGRLLFEHNQIEEADRILSELIDEDPDNMEALAWYGANKCKIVGESQPWFMGIRKLIRVKSCLNKVKIALDTDPDNFTIQLVAISTGSIVNVGDSLSWASVTRNKFEDAISANPNYYPQEVVDYFFFAAAENDLAHGKTDSAKQYLDKVRESSDNSFLVKQATDRLNML